MPCTLTPAVRVVAGGANLSVVPHVPLVHGAQRRLETALQTEQVNTCGICGDNSIISNLIADVFPMHPLHVYAERVPFLCRGGPSAHGAQPGLPLWLHARRLTLAAA